MSIRFMRLAGALFLIVLGGVALLAAFTIAYPPTYSATTILPRTTSTLDAKLIPSSLFHSNEYERRLVLISPGKTDVEVKLFPDTGGYKRAELYELADGRFLFKGHHELLEINPQQHSVREISLRYPDRATYIGAFDYDRVAQTWRYFGPTESPAELKW